MREEQWRLREEQWGWRIEGRRVTDRRRMKLHAFMFVKYFEPLSRERQNLLVILCHVCNWNRNKVPCVCMRIFSVVCFPVLGVTLVWCLGMPAFASETDSTKDYHLNHGSTCDSPDFRRLVGGFRGIWCTPFILLSRIICSHAPQCSQILTPE